MVHMGSHDLGLLMLARPQFPAVSQEPQVAEPSYDSYRTSRMTVNSEREVLP